MNKIDEDLTWFTSLENFRRASTSSLEMNSTLSLPICISESEEDDDKEKFEDIRIPDDRNVPQRSLDEDQGNAFMLFTHTTFKCCHFRCY